MTTEPRSNDMEWCTADVIVDGYHYLECTLPVGHSGPHRRKLHLSEQSDPITIAGQIEWTAATSDPSSLHHDHSGRSSSSVTAYHVAFSAYMRLSSLDLEEGETPVDAARRILAPVGALIDDVEDVAYEIERPDRGEQP